jgi:DNA mismatch endonuclease (patch repair protein)
MQGNKSRDTKPELAIRRLLHAHGLRYRVCARPLPELRRTADIVFRPDRVAVEVRGCFWHGCPEHYRGPAANGGYWAEKVARNMARDADTAQQWSAAGWTLVEIWEHEIPEAAAARVVSVIAARRALVPRPRPQGRRQ